MSYEQIRAINNAMSLLSTVDNIPTTREVRDAFTNHAKELQASGVDINIVEHFLNIGAAIVNGESTFILD